MNLAAIPSFFSFLLMLDVASTFSADAAFWVFLSILGFSGGSWIAVLAGVFQVLGATIALIARAVS
ncbi:MAG: hypothetical protein ACTSUQ_07850 [Candidatus Freyarchaeota archaeon]